MGMRSLILLLAIVAGQKTCKLATGIQNCLDENPTAKNIIYAVDLHSTLNVRRRLQILKFIQDFTSCFQANVTRTSVLSFTETTARIVRTFPRDTQDRKSTHAFLNKEFSKRHKVSGTKSANMLGIEPLLNSLINENEQTKLIIFSSRPLSKIKQTVLKFSILRSKLEIFSFAFGLSNMNQLKYVVSKPANSHIFNNLPGSLSLISGYSNAIGQSFCQLPDIINSKKILDKTIGIQNIQTTESSIKFKVSQPTYLDAILDVTWTPKGQSKIESHEPGGYIISGLPSGKIITIRVNALNKENEKVMVIAATKPRKLAFFRGSVTPTAVKTQKYLKLKWPRVLNKDIQTRLSSSNPKTAKILKYLPGGADVLLSNSGETFEFTLEQFTIDPSETVSQKFLKAIPPSAPTDVELSKEKRTLSFRTPKNTKYSRFDLQNIGFFGTQKVEVTKIPGKQIYQPRIDYETKPFLSRVQTISHDLKSKPVSKFFFSNDEPEFTNEVVILYDSGETCFYDPKTLDEITCKNDTVRLKTRYLDKEQLISTLKSEIGFSIKTNGHKLITEIPMPFDIHYDYLGNNIYWSDTDSISLVNIKVQPVPSTYQNKIIALKNIKNIQIWFDIDYVRRNIYYCSGYEDDGVQYQTIEKANMDGSEQTIVYTSPLPERFITAMTMNSPKGILYWAEKKIHTNSAWVYGMSLANNKAIRLFRDDNADTINFLQVIEGNVFFIANSKKLFTSSDLFLRKIESKDLPRSVSWLSAKNYKDYFFSVRSKSEFLTGNGCNDMDCNGICLPLDLFNNAKCLPSCPDWAMICQQSKMCIPVSYKCDGKADCPDSEDEADCELIKNNQNHQCDGFIDNRDAPDEANCEYVSKEFQEIFCDFESAGSNCRIKQSKDDDFDWLLQQDASKTLGTGVGNRTEFSPQNSADSKQYTTWGQEAPVYLLLSSIYRGLGESATIYLDTLPAGPYCVSLDVIFFGKDMGSLIVTLDDREILHLDKSNSQIWKMYSRHAVCTKTACTLMVTGTVGKGHRSDIAINSLRVRRGPCSRQLSCHFSENPESNCASTQG